MTRRLLLLLFASSLMGAAQEDGEGLVPLSERMQDVYAAAKPDGFLIDPQRLLRGGEARERREFLKYHSSDSLIDLYVVLFKGDQLLFNPGDLTGLYFNSRADSKPAVIVHYFMGRPERAQMYLSPGFQELVPLAEHGRALESAVERAKTGVSPLDELQKFMLQSTIRIIRMESLLSDGTVSPAPLEREEPKTVDPQEAERDSLMQALGGFWAAWNLKLVGGAAVLAGAWLLLRWLRLRASYEFPESEAAERLGGAHGAGVGAVIEFGKNSKPPAAQLEKMKLH